MRLSFFLTDFKIQNNMKAFDRIISIAMAASALFASAELDAMVVKGRVTCAGKGVSDVVVSDGVSVSRTDAKGRYSLDVAPNSRFVFVSTPSGHISSTMGGDNCFWQMVEDGKRNYDFTILRNPVDDNRHSIVVLADPQISDADEFLGLREHVKTITSTVQGLSGSHVFGICLGDIVGWNHALYPEYNEIMSATGLEFRNVIGNHDMTNYGRSFETSTSDFERMYGPTYYSYNVGKVHHIVLNDNFFVGKDWYYIGYLPEAQISWMEKDLACIDEDTKVVVSIHIPTTLREWDRTGYNFDYSKIADLLCNKKALYDILEPYDALILSGHMHMGDNEIISPKLMEHNITSLGGAWWCGSVCIDGSPAGFKLYTFDGTDVSWRFVGCGVPEDCQMKVYANNPVYPGEVVVNVFDYDTMWRVEYFEDGVKVCDMERFDGTDPLAMELYKDPASLKRTWVCALPTGNLLRAKISAEAKTAEVRVTDRFGRKYSEVVTL